MPGRVHNPYTDRGRDVRESRTGGTTAQFGKSYDRSRHLGQKEEVGHKGLGLRGRRRLSQVRRVYNDVNFIDRFHDPEFIEKPQVSTSTAAHPHRPAPSSPATRAHQTGRPLYQLTPNMGNRSSTSRLGTLQPRELYVAQHNGQDIESRYAVETLKNIVQALGTAGALRPGSTTNDMLTYEDTKPQAAAITTTASRRRPPGGVTSWVQLVTRTGA